MRKRIRLSAGAFTALLIGIFRGLGALYLLTREGSARETGAGCGLGIIALWLILSGALLLSKRSLRRRNLLLIGIAVFWLGGIVNGFLLFGAPQLAGQLINTLLCAIVLVCIWPTRLYRDGPKAE